MRITPVPYLCLTNALTTEPKSTQTPQTERADNISDFATPDELFQHIVMELGMENLNATFERLINKVIDGICGCRAYIDNIGFTMMNRKNNYKQLEIFFLDSVKLM